MAVRKVVFDIETVSASLRDFDPSTMELTVVGIYDSVTGEYSSYTKEELGKLWPVMEKADILIGYNSDHFDIPILNRYYPGDLTQIKSVDLLKEVRNVLGRRLKLESIAQATLGYGKSADGIKAGVWWNEGKVELVRKYCLDDVKITKEIYDYARTNKKLKYMDYEGEREIKLDTSGWEKVAAHALTHTLPF